MGLSPAWDISCRGGGLEWGRHVEIDEQVVRAAGKALNVSSALAWMGRESFAAGLWGSDDYELMRSVVARMDGLVQPRMTRAEGRTRQNITVVDTDRGREMHLRKKNDLASIESLRRLNSDVRRLVGPDDLCVFSGAMPGGALLEPAVGVVQACHELGARLVIDSYGEALRGIVDRGLAWLIAPNVEELRELLGSAVSDTPGKLVAAARDLLDSIEIVLVSRGKEGAVVVTREGAWSGHAIGEGAVLETVGCGDYLLAGFLAGITERRPARTALQQGLKVATARAYGWTDTRTWPGATRRIKVDIQRL